jgi:hypothetical protein
MYLTLSLRYSPDLCFLNVVGFTQRAPLACGSMVLFFFCRSFFRPADEKMTYKGQEIRSLRKSYVDYNRFRGARNAATTFMSQEPPTLS